MEKPDANIAPKRTSFPSQGGQDSAETLSRRFESVLERADAVIYAVVGVCFLFGAVFGLGYACWDFGSNILGVLKSGGTASHTIATAIIQFVSGLLLVLIIMEVLGTVMHYLRAHATSLRPFLFIGIISATRSILSIGARLSVAGSTIEKGEFTNAMIELGVSAAVVLALGLTLKLLGRSIDEPADKGAQGESRYPE